MNIELFSATRRQRAQWVLVLVVTLLVAVVMWASFMQIELRSQAMGQVIASERTQIVQASVDGVLARLLVREGQSVGRHQLLAVLEQTQAQAAVNETGGKVAALQAAIVRYEAEMRDIQQEALEANSTPMRSSRARGAYQGPLDFPKSVRAYPDFVNNQTELYERRRRALLEELRVMGRLRDNVAEELRVSEPLLKTGDISRVEILRLQKQVTELEGQIINRRNKYFQDAQAELTRAQEELRSQQQSLADRHVNFDRTEIRAPAAGIVRNIRVTTRSARVRPGDVILDLLPTDSELLVEGKLKPGDIGHVAVGQPATVKLDAWDYSIYGVLDGEVVYLSPDALSEDTRAGESIYYRIRVRIRPDSRLRDRQGQTIEVQSGMTGQIDVRTGNQTVLTYLTKPVVKTLQQSFNER
jgi:multidrug efflux pump subunit AcrA (membrane-fusion protein)